MIMLIFGGIFIFRYVKANELLLDSLLPFAVAFLLLLSSVIWRKKMRQSGDVYMKTHNRTPENEREQLRQKELESNPAGNLRDAIDRAQIGTSPNGAGGSDWKSTGISLIVLIIGFFVVAIFLT